MEYIAEKNENNFGNKKSRVTPKMSLKLRETAKVPQKEEDKKQSMTSLPKTFFPKDSLKCQRQNNATNTYKH